MTARADKYAPASVTVTVASGESATAKLQLELVKITPPPVGSPYASPVTKDGEWSTGVGKTVDLKPGSLYHITFLRPGRVPLKHKGKKAEFRVISYPDAEIIYELDGQHLAKTVKRVSNTTQKTFVPMPGWTNEQVTVQIAIQDHKITVSTGDAKDEFTDQEHSWSAARISLRGDQYFRVIGPQ